MPVWEMFLERNKRFGVGYQVRIVTKELFEDGTSGDVLKDEVLDEAPYTMSEAKEEAQKYLERVNEEYGLAIRLDQVLCPMMDAVEANRLRDVESARYYRDTLIGLYSEGRELPDIRPDLIDRNPMDLTPAEVVVWYYLGWKELGDEGDEAAVMRFCEYLAMKGYGGGAKDIMRELSSLPVDAGIEWIRTRYAAHIDDDENMLDYVNGLK